MFLCFNDISSTGSRGVPEDSLCNLKLLIDGLFDISLRPGIASIYRYIGLIDVDMPI